MILKEYRECPSLFPLLDSLVACPVFIIPYEMNEVYVARLALWIDAYLPPLPMRGNEHASKA
jgi:hypothetical protein